MSDDTVKVRVADDHFKTYFNLGDKKASKKEVTEAEVSPALVAGVEAGTLELVEGSLTSDQKQFREDDNGGEESVSPDESEESEAGEEEKSEDGEEKVECSECGKGFDTERGMKQHRTKVHSSEE